MEARCCALDAHGLQACPSSLRVNPWLSSFHQKVFQVRGGSDTAEPRVGVSGSPKGLGAIKDGNLADSSEKP